MEISPPAKSPDTDQAETPKIHPGKPLPFTNGVLKRHAPPHAPSYKECMKNHAAAMGGHALDGCGEFMPSPSTIPSDPTSLTCAACGCHRNFHRRNSPPLAPPTHVIEYHPNHRHHPPPPYGGLGGARSPGGSPSPPPISSSYYPASAPHMLLALSSGGCEPPLSSSSRKRFRTKFSQDQKDKMHEFAEKLGWKMQKASDDLVSAFCADVGVERGVFKVWMHNNKNTFAKHQTRDPNAGPAPALPAPHSGTALIDPNNGSSGNGYSKNGDGTYGSSTSS